MFIDLAIGLLGAGIFLRIVGKEMNRRHRHLLLRLAEQEKILAEREAAALEQSTDPAEAQATNAATAAPTSSPAPEAQAA